MSDIQVKVNIKGQELFDLMTSKSEKFAKKGLRAALQAGSKVIWDAMRTNVRKGWHLWPGKNRSRDYGFITDHIGIKTKISDSSEMGSSQIGPVKKAYWAMFLEFGTSKMAAKPFIRPTYENNKQAALDAFTNKMREVFQTEFYSRAASGDVESNGGDSGGTGGYSGDSSSDVVGNGG